MLERLRFRRQRPPASLPCPDIVGQRGETFTGARNKIVHVRSAFDTAFCAWLEHGPAVSGSPLSGAQWREFRHSEARFDVMGAILVARKTRSTVATLSIAGQAEPSWMVRAAGWRNTVWFCRADGTRLARFPLLRPSIDVDWDELTQAEVPVFLAVLGSGITSQVRHMSLLLWSLPSVRLSTNP